MNVTEANAAQRLLRWLVDPHEDSEQAAAGALDAAVTLADRSSRRLAAGVTGAQLAARWPELLQGCAGCPECLPAPVPFGARPVEDRGGGGVSLLMMVAAALALTGLGLVRADHPVGLLVSAAGTLTAAGLLLRRRRRDHDGGDQDEANGYRLRPKRGAIGFEVDPDWAPPGDDGSRRDEAIRRSRGTGGGAS